VLSTPGATLLITMYFTIPPLTSSPERCADGTRVSTDASWA
jgi:hypothetical protein